MKVLILDTEVRFTCLLLEPDTSSTPSKFLPLNYSTQVKKSCKTLQESSRSCKILHDSEDSLARPRESGTRLSHILIILQDSCGFRARFFLARILQYTLWQESCKTGGSPITSILFLFFNTSLTKSRCHGHFSRLFTLNCNPKHDRFGTFEPY